MPIRLSALTLTANNLFCGGVPASDDAKTFLKAIDDQLGGEIHILDRKTGKRRGSIRLPSAPMWDGMAAANECLYVSMRNGSIACYGSKQDLRIGCHLARGADRFAVVIFFSMACSFAATAGSSRMTFLA